MRYREKTADNVGHCCCSQSPEGERPIAPLSILVLPFPIAML